MRIKDFMKQVTESTPMHVEREYPVPKGWLTVEQIREELNLAYTRNASSRALDLFRRGVLERQPHQFKANTGQCHKAYIYRPKPPFKSVKAAADGLFAIQSEKVPKGYVRIVEYATTRGVSDVAVRCRIARAGLKPVYFKTARGISGIHRNAFYRKADLDRLCG